MLYLDTSAFLKVLVTEEHSDQLRSTLGGAPVWSSTLLDVEAHRAGPRLGVGRAAVSDTLEWVSLIFPTETTFAVARDIGPDTLRALDALHLASALELGADLEAVVTYDRRLALGCEALGVAVLAPGLPPTWWRLAKT